MSQLHEENHTPIYKIVELSFVSLLILPKIDIRRLTYTIIHTSLYSNFRNITYGNKVASRRIWSNG